MPVRGRLKALVADPVTDFAGDVAAMLGGRCEVRRVDSWLKACTVIGRRPDFVILAADLPKGTRRLLLGLIGRRVPVIRLGGGGEGAIPEGYDVCLDRFPSPHRLRRAVDSICPEPGP